VEVLAGPMFHLLRRGVLGRSVTRRPAREINATLLTMAETAPANSSFRLRALLARHFPHAARRIVVGSASASIVGGIKERTKRR